MHSVIRYIVVSLFLLCPAVAFWAYKGTRPVRIGFIGGITGRYADLGMAGRNGAMLAVEERNATGGIDGHPVELLVRDDRQDPEIARQMVRELIGLQTEAIIGPMTSSMAMEITPLLNTHNVIMMSPTTMTNELAGKDDNFLRIIAAADEYAAISARYLFRKLGQRRVAAIYDQENKAYSESWLRGFRESFSGLGGTLVTEAGFQPSRSPFFSRKVREVLANNPEAVLIIANTVDAAMICQQIRKISASTTIFLPEWPATERFIELAGGAAEGVYASQFFNRNDRSAQYLNFLAAYRERFRQEPGYADLAGYDAAMVTLEGLAARKRGAPLKETILAQRKFQGIQQTMVFDRFGNATRNTYLTLVRNGQYRTLE